MSVPVGASDPHAAAAEQAQFTAGEGPCLYAHLTRGTALITNVADAGAVGRRYWPTYCLLLGRITTFRSVVAVPVPTPPPTLLPPVKPATSSAGPPTDRAGAGSGPSTQRSLVPVPLVLTCYSQHPLPAPGATTDAAAEAAAQALQAMLRRIETVSAALGAVLAEVTAAAPSAQSDWLDSRTAAPRAAVWQAEEALMDADDSVDREGALAALRTYALIHAVSIDAAAAGLVQGHLSAEQVLGQDH